MKIDLSQFRQTFLQESAEHVATMESGLLALRSAPQDAETLNAIFRSAHSIKGGAGSFGLDALVRLTHALESLLDRMRAAEIDVAEPLIALLLESVDELRDLLIPGDAGVLPPSSLPLSTLTLIERLQTLNGLHDPERPAAEAASLVASSLAHDPAACAASDLAVYRIAFHPDREMFASGTNPIVLLRNLAALGRVAVTELHTEELPSLADLDPALCYLSWTIEIATLHSIDALREVFEFVEHLAEIAIVRIDTADEVEVKDTAVSLRSLPSLQPAPVDPPPGDPASSFASGSARTLVSSSMARSPARPGAGGESASIRVATEKVDRLIDLVGELVIAHVMTAQMVERFDPVCLPRLRASVAAMERNTRELHERVMAVRMLPVGTLFQRYERTVYDIARATGKQIRLTLAGEEAEVDKSMLEMLGDPLTHLIRNAADHGIESPAVRLAIGKPAEGAIGLRAFHRAGRVVLEISDDGAGIDPAFVRAKAVARGLIPASSQLTDEQLRLLIFEPGFSTRDAVSDLSGRGVGMDVVRQNVRRMNGSIAVSSEVGRGSTVSIELPLTLAILEGLLVRVADRTLVLPLLSVVETVSPRPGQIQRVAEQGDVVLIRNESVPLLSLRRYLGLTAASSPSASPASHSATQASEAQTATHSAPHPLVVVVEAGRRKIGLAVDELLGQQQVVVKSLERHLRKVEGLMGATILGDGCVAPILDVAGLAGLNLFSLSHSAASGFSGQAAVFSHSISPEPGESGESAHAMV